MVTLQDARDVTNVIVDSIKPILVMLFGSVAKEGSGTDLDLLIIVDEEYGGSEGAYLSVHKSLKEFYKRFAIDPFIIPESIFREHYFKGSPFLRLIFQEGRYLYMKDGVKEWVTQAEDELNMAVYLLDGKFFKGACYHSQQCVEKAIKTMLLNRGWELEKTHSIERLVSIGEDYKVKVDISDEEIVFIDSIYRSRYPFDAGLLPLGAPSEEDAQRAVNMAKQIFKGMKEAL